MVPTMIVRSFRPLAFAAVAFAIGFGSASANDKLGVTMPTVQGPFFTAELYGITQEAKKQGFDPVVLDAGGYANVDRQVSDFQNLLAQQAKAILIDPASDTAFAGALREAKDADVPVISTGAPLTGTDASVSASHCELGKEMGQGAMKLLPNGGTMAALTGPAGGFWATDRWRCFKEAIKDSKIKIVAEQSSEPDAAVGLTLASDFLQKFPDVNLLYGADDTVGVGAARAVQAEKACGKVKVLTAILGETTEELMKAGCIDYVVAQQVVLIGRTSVKMARALADHKKPSEKDVVIPNLVVTPANLNSVDIGTIRPPKN